MNVEPPDYVLSLPPNVKPGSGNGVYQVQSRSEPGRWRNVDVTMLQCDCPSATKGKSRKARKQFGYLPSQFFCPHLKDALLYHAIAMVCLLEQDQAKGQAA